MNRHVVALVTVSMCAAGAVAYGLPDCNYKVTKATKYCQDPFVKCEAYNAGTEQNPNWVCPTNYDDSQPIIPGCDSDPLACDSYCSSNGNTPCNQSRKCRKKSGSGANTVCEDNGANGPPTYTTLYFGGGCNSQCGG